MRFEIERHPLLAVTACAAEGIPWEDPLATVLVFPDAVYATDSYLLARYRFPAPILPAVPAGGLPLAACDLAAVDARHDDAVSFEIFDRSTFTVDGEHCARTFGGIPYPYRRGLFDELLDAAEHGSVGDVSFSWWVFRRIARVFERLGVDFGMSFSGAEGVVRCRPVSTDRHCFDGEFALAVAPRREFKDEEEGEG